MGEPRASRAGGADLLLPGGGNAGPRTPDTVYIVRRDSPRVELTCVSSFPAKPDRLKLRKDIMIFPVKLTLKADYVTETREFVYGMSARVRKRRYGVQYFLLCSP
jgi:hypothetical protein